MDFVPKAIILMVVVQRTALKRWVTRRRRRRQGFSVVLAAHGDRLGAVQVKRLLWQGRFVARTPAGDEAYSAMARRLLHNGWVIMDFPLSQIDSSGLSSV